MRADPSTRETASSPVPPATWRSRLKDPSFLAMSLVGWSVRAPWLVVIVSAIATVLMGYVAVTRFQITTQTDQLLHVDAKWAEDKAAFESAFPQLVNSIVVVIDGATADQADDAANRLTDALEKAPGPAIQRVWRPDGGAWFDREGLLLLPTEQVKSATEKLVEQQPTISALAGDPTLRGLSRLIAAGAQQGRMGQAGGELNRFSAVVEAVLKGDFARLSWQGLSGGGDNAGASTRKFVLVDPKLDFRQLEPAVVATKRIRTAAYDLGLSPDAGIRVRLTGAPPLADEEFATVREGAPLHLGLTVVAIAVILFLALRAPSIIVAVLLTTFAGLIITIGVGLLMVGRFNVISVAVAALFLGLGVDFGIQFAVRYRDERYKVGGMAPALHEAAAGVGWSLTLAALSLLAGFFAFLPTSFKGVSELGLITGVGMIIAFTASLTLLPALIAILRPAGEKETVEMPALAAIDHWILRHRKLVMIASCALVVAGLPFLIRVHFDANPMHLRSEKTEAVSTFLDLSRGEGTTPNTLNVLAPSLAAAQPLAKRLSELPSVDRVVTLQTFLPTDQDPKLKLIKAAAEEYSDLYEDLPPAPAPTDADVVQALKRAAAALAAPAAAGDGKPAAAPTADAKRLSDALGRLADAPPERRAAASEALLGDFPLLVARLKLLLRPEPITIATLPDTLKADWIAADGRARIDVAPKGDANDNAVLEHFSDEVRTVAPNAAGAPIEVVESGKVIVQAFLIAGALALVAIFVILTIALRNAMDVALTLGPLVIAVALTLEAADLIGMSLNLANIIALPLMLAVGVNFHIYYMIAWRNGVADMLASSLTRAIFFSSLTTGVAFGSLWLSNHPGTASMGKLLTLSLVFTLLAAFVIVPAFLGPPRSATKSS